MSKWPTDELLAIIDGNNLLMRAFFSMQNKNLTTSSGVPTGALFGSIIAHANIVRTLAPTKMVWFFDSRGGSKARKEIFPEYKGNRAGNHDIGKQLSAFEAFLSVMDVRYYSEGGVEADDLIAGAVKGWDPDVPKVIVSGDHDFHQLVSKDPKVSVFKPGAGKNSPPKVFSHKTTTETYEMPPEKLPLAWALAGDKSDNIDGVRGVGFKTAQKILHRNGWDLDRAMKSEERLRGWGDIVERNLQLIDLREKSVEAGLPVRLEECHLEKEHYDQKTLVEFLEKWEMASLVGKEKAIGLYG